MSSNNKSDKNNYASINTERPLEEIVEVKKKEHTTLCLAGIDIASYSKNPTEVTGKRIDLDEKYLKGHIFLNTDFFARFDMSGIKPGSDMRNIAKGFFKINDENYAILVQYLMEGGTSREHYHNLGEAIVQLAGYSKVELRPADSDAKLKTVGLETGNSLWIPPKTLHTVIASDGGSLTVPIKQTNPKKSDHFYQDRSYERLSKEIHELITLPHYNSGNEIESALTGYQESLTEEEKNHFDKYLRTRNENEENPNIKRILGNLTNSPA